FLDLIFNFFLLNMWISIRTNDDWNSISNERNTMISKTGWRQLLGFFEQGSKMSEELRVSRIEALDGRR
ncbi:hypothetical protein A2U01_0066869, partial [Trifolium medium]|nr:hypothetical protein [Trifolium medium]